MDYVVWEHRDEGNSCMLLPPEGVDRDWELLEGVPRAADFPTDAVMRMSPMHPRNMGLPDNVMNHAALVVVHRRLQRFLEARSLLDVEYLPVTIINHKGRVGSVDHVIVHAIEPQDCLDLARSGARFSAIMPTDVSDVDTLVLDPGRIDPRIRLFRIKAFGYPVIVERSLADEILQAGFTGTAFIELGEYGE